MSRRISPAYFQLQAVERPELLQHEGYLNVLRASQLDPGAPPVVLRWSTKPVLGFPMGPFEVWRRSAANYPVEALSGAVATSGERYIGWGLRPMYLVSVAISSVSGSVRVCALDAGGKVIPGQDLSVSAAGSVLLRANGIAAVRIEGTAQVAGLLGVHAELLANASGWERFDTVGLPLSASEVAAPAYAAAPQGYEPASQDGPAAALLRLALAGACHLDPPALPASDLPSVTWPPPPPQKYLTSLRDQLLGPLLKCLTTRDNRSLASRHADFRFEATVQGLNQIGGSAPTADARAELPLVAMTQLMAFGDGFASVALGYGTVDIGTKKGRDPTGAQAAGPRLFSSLAAAAVVRRGWDYMVTGRFQEVFGPPAEFAALAALPLPPGVPSSLLVERVHENRPMATDVAGSEALRLSWPPGNTYPSYAVVGSPALGQAAVLNAKRTCGVGFDPFVPPRAAPVDGAPAPDERVRFVDPVVPVPLAGTTSVRYAVAALDGFGRWSGWRMATRTLSARAVAAPQILQLTLTPDPALANASGCGGTIEIEIGWNAEDRSLERIELFGRFLPVLAKPEASFTGGFLDGAVQTAPLSIRLSGSVSGERVPASVELLSGSAPQQRIRVTVTDVRYDFSTTEKLAFAVWARAYERVRPSDAGPLGEPRRSDALDPRVPPVPVLSPDITWTALPDATRRARGVLSWAPTANTRGYVVWEATETALLQALGQPEAAPGTSLGERAVRLRTLITPATEDAISRAFARWNKELLTAPRAQIELPGAADILYAYRVSAMSATNIEGPRSSGLALLAVPSRRVPGPPSLASTRTSDGGILLRATPAAGSFAEGFRLFRVRKAIAAGALGTMGPPVALESAWAPEGASGGATLVDTPPPSWKPVYYRVVSVAHDAPSEGRYGGTSEPSGALQVFVPPSARPNLLNVSVGGGTLSFSTDVPDFPTPIGKGRVEVFAVVMTGQRIERTLLAAADPAQVEPGPPTPTSFGKAVSASGVTWSLLLGSETRVSVVVTDPLGRSTQATVEA